MPEMDTYSNVTEVTSWDLIDKARLKVIKSQQETINDQSKLVTQLAKELRCISGKLALVMAFQFLQCYLKFLAQ